MKKMIALFLVMLLAVSMTACSTKKNVSSDTVKQEGETNTSDSGQSGDEEASKEIPTLTMLTFTDWYKSGWEALDAYIEENAETLGFRLDIQMIAGGGEGEELLKAKFATGDLPDLLQSYGAKWLTNVAGVLDQMQVLENVDMSEYDQSMLEQGGFIWDGKLYGIPVDSTSLVGVFYNKTVFANAGIDKTPATWEEFLEACDKIKASGVTPLYYAGADTWTLQCFTHFGFNQDVADSGLSYREFWNEMNTNQRHYSDAKNFAAAIEKSKEMVELGYVNESYLSDTYDMAQTALAEGTAGMHVNGTWIYDEIASKYPEAADQIGSFVLPLSDGTNYTCSSMPGAIGMTEACSNTEAGQKALNFLASKEAQQIYANAQPGIYLNKEVQCDLSDAYQTLYEAMSKGESMEVWQNGNLYGYGDYHIHVQDYLAGGMSLDEVIELLDSDTAKNAKAAGDSNWN
jgi:raffinose/stachyose/melibiose transport system substrate-binding protein